MLSVQVNSKIKNTKSSFRIYHLISYHYWWDLHEVQPVSSTLHQVNRPSSDLPLPWQCGSSSSKWGSSIILCPEIPLKLKSLRSLPNAFRVVFTVQDYSFHWDFSLLTIFLNIFQASQCFQKTFELLCSTCPTPLQSDDYHQQHSAPSFFKPLTLAWVSLVVRAKANPSQPSS